MKFAIFVLYFFVEIYSIITFAEVFGIFSLFVEFIVSAVVGFVILASQYKAMFAYSPLIFNNPFGLKNLINKSLFRLLGGILLILPGIISDIVGIVCFFVALFYPIQSNSQFFGDSTQSNDDPNIIDAEIIETDKDEAKRLG